MLGKKPVLRILMGALVWLVSSWAVAESVGGEINWWPLYHSVEEGPYLRAAEDSWIGPFFGRKSPSDDGPILSFRPFITRFTESPIGSDDHFHVLYPLFSYRNERGGWRWSLLNLVRMRRNYDLEYRAFDAFPFVFHESSPNPDDSYTAVWPLVGQLKGRLGRDRIRFFLWPLWIETWKRDEYRISSPWPFIQTLQGPKSGGFALWPLYGHFKREQDYDHRWFLWPIFYHYKDRLNQPVPYIRTGVLPLYHRETGPGMKSESFLWPFFGYTREWEPRPAYHEIRYFWPFIVQGRGDVRHVNRLLPLYAHEQGSSYEKWWYLWPIAKRERIGAGEFPRKKFSLFYFLFHQETQLLRDGRASKTFLWPFFSRWQSGAGRVQFQALDPFSVFFPNNEVIRENWLPLFSLYRYDERYGNRRHSLLWNLVVLEKHSGGTGGFYLGPLFEIVDDGSEGHWQLLKGLLGVERRGDQRRLKFLWLR